MIELVLAQAAAGTLVSWLIGAVIIAAIIGLVVIGFRVFGVPIPQWVWQVVGIVICAAVIIVAIKFVASMW